MAAVLAASLALLAAAGSVGWWWTSRQQPAAALSASEANPQKILKPVVNPDNRADVVHIYPTLQHHRALAIAPVARASLGTGGWPTQEAAAEKIIERCSQYFNEACGLLALDDTIFVPRAGESWALRDAPRIHYAGIFNPERIPSLRESEQLRPDIAAYATLAGPKAAAFHALGILVLKTNAPGQRAAEESALAECKANPNRAMCLNGPCYLYAVGNQVVLPLRSTVPMTPAPPK